MEYVGTAVDAVGVLVVIVGAVYSTARFFSRKEQLPATPYRVYRQNIGRAILLGHKFLVAGDIIENRRSLSHHSECCRSRLDLLGVFIRTFLSMSLEVELEGKWPWQRGDTDQRAAPAR